MVLEIARRHLVFLCSLPFLLSGCAAQAGEPLAEGEMVLPPADTTHERAPSADPQREEQVEGFITIEGMREPMTFRLFRSPDTFPLPFETYVPADMEAEAMVNGEGAAIAFRPTFGGDAAGRAVLSITIPAGQPTAAEAQRLVRNLAGGMGETEEVSGGGYSWALEQRRFAGEGLVGSVALGRHDGTYFYVVTAYPVEMGDGFGPRVARILGEWKWTDGSRLGS